MLNSIINKANLLIEINQRIKPFLPEYLLHQCTVANLRQNILVIQCTNGSAATKLRYMLPELLQKCRTTGNLPLLASIQVIVRPETASNHPSSNFSALNRPIISPQSARLIATVAATISDPNLAKALEKLSGIRCSD